MTLVGRRTITHGNWLLEWIGWHDMRRNSKVKRSLLNIILKINKFCNPTLFRYWFFLETFLSFINQGRHISDMHSQSEPFRIHNKCTYLLSFVAKNRIIMIKQFYKHVLLLTSLSHTWGYDIFIFLSPFRPHDGLRRWRRKQKVTWVTQVKGCKCWPMLGTDDHWGFRTHDTYCRALSSGAITTCLNDLGLPRLEFEHPSQTL